MDAQGLHGLVCKQSLSMIIRHHALNDVVARAIQSAGHKGTSGVDQTGRHPFFVIFEPSGLSLIHYRELLNAA